MQTSIHNPRGGLTRRPHGVTILDVLVASVLTVSGAALVLATTTELQDQMTACLDKARGMGTALLAYSADHANLMPGDSRDPNREDAVDKLRHAPGTEQEYAQSWLAKLDGYMVIGPEALDCPVVDDHRKSDWWPADYVINRWGIGTSTAVAETPSQAVLAAEPNMTRGSVGILADVFAWWADKVSG